MLDKGLRSFIEEDFVATLPLGPLAARVGPKPVMSLNFSGFILSWAWMLCVCETASLPSLSMDIRLIMGVIDYFHNVFSVDMVLLAPMFTVFGPASHVMTALIYSEATIFTKNRYDRYPGVSSIFTYTLLQYCHFVCTGGSSSNLSTHWIYNRFLATYARSICSLLFYISSGLAFYTSNFISSSWGDI